MELPTHYHLSPSGGPSSKVYFFVLLNYFEPDTYFAPLPNPSETMHFLLKILETCLMGVEGQLGMSTLTLAIIMLN